MANKEDNAAMNVSSERQSVYSRILGESLLPNQQTGMLPTEDEHRGEEPGPSGYEEDDNEVNNNKHFNAQQ